MRPFLVACVAVLCVAPFALQGCEGGTPGRVSLNVDGAVPFNGASLPLDAGDGGDAGADAGTDGGFDGGCTHYAGSGSNGFVIDDCNTSTHQQQALNISEASCSVHLSWGTGACDGVISGSQNAFDGTCGAFGHCTSPSTPGIITCDNAGAQCFIKTCGVGGCSP